MLYREVVGHLKEKHDLTRKEAEVLAEIIISGPNKETIALKLDIAPSTAYLHFKRIYEKLKVDGMSQLYHVILVTHQEIMLSTSQSEHKKKPSHSD